MAGKEGERMSPVTQASFSTKLFFQFDVPLSFQEVE